MKFAVIIVCSFLIACSSDTSKSNDDGDDYYPTYTNELEDTVRTLDLTYIAWAANVQTGRQNQTLRKLKMTEINLPINQFL